MQGTRQARQPRSVRFTLVALLLSGCVGYVDGTAGGGSRPGSLGPDGTSTTGPGSAAQEAPAPELAKFACDGPEVGALPRRIWRLNGTQYLGALRAFFAGRDRPEQAAVPLAGISSPFEFTNESDRFSTLVASYTMTDQEFTSVVDAAQTASVRFVAQLRADPISCLGAPQRLGFAECMKSLIATRGPLLFQRPMTEEEVARYAKAATDSVVTLGEDEAAALAFQALLSSPNFLFRTEIGPDVPTAGGPVRLTQFEVASALAYGLTDGPPSSALYHAAEQEELTTPEQIAVQARSLIAAAGPAPTTISRFVKEYFRIRGLEKVFKDNPDLNPANRTALIEDSESLISDLVASRSADFFVKLLTTKEVRYRSQTFRLYGLPDPNDRVAFAKASLPDRAGLLTQPAWLASLASNDDSHPVARGRFINESLLCRAIPPVPIGVVPVLPVDATRTTREKLALHVEDPMCAACHTLMDPLGLVFEGFDQNGRSRTDDHGKPVDSSGALSGAGAQDGAVTGPVELADRLAASEVVQQCMIRHSFRYWMGRSEAAWDGCSLVDAQKAYAASGGDYTELVASLFSSRSFQFRSAQ